MDYSDFIPPFVRIKDMSTTAALTEKELHEYHQWLKVTNDERLKLQRAEESGIEKGKMNQAWVSAEKLFQIGLDFETISDVTGLSIHLLKQKFH